MANIDKLIQKSNELQRSLSKSAENESALKNQPESVKNVEMRDYQLNGLNWIVSLYHLQINGILGDEMGLGKTLQTISMISWLSNEKNNKGPFLVLAPLSTMMNWEAEFKKFAPSVKSVTYMGDQAQREELRKEMGTHKNPHFEVALVTYELVMKDVEYFSQFKWEYLVVDEAHRLKNSKGSLYNALISEFKFKHKLFLTGTPVQNNLSELWALLHFLNPSTFSDEEGFLIRFSDVNKKGKESLKNELHQVLKPFLLRRMKSDVLLDLPSKKEMILYTPMTEMQKKYYKFILTKNVDALSTGKSKQSLMNIIMHLRKCCNHPYLFDGAEPLFDGEYKLGEHIVENSGKLRVLDKLLVKLKEEGRRVLIFSQMTRMLDIIQDYLDLREWTYERLDGSVRGSERFAAVKNFSETDVFAFLLSTRSGGQGLNLTAADTVVFIDSDWNPQMDLQAAARAHRIGQKKEVTIFRLISSNSVEEIVLRRALQKLTLTNFVIEEGKFLQDSNKNSQEEEDKKPLDLKSYIKFGLTKIFLDEKDSSLDDNIESILSKGEIVPDKDEEQKEEKKEEKKMEKVEEEEEEEKGNMYVYEGIDYSREAAHSDDSVFAGIVAEKNKEKVEKMKAGGMDLDESLLKKPKASKEELAQRRLEKKRAKWAENNYESRGIELEKEPKDETDADEDDADASTADDENLNDIHYVDGDATRPTGPRSAAFIIVNCLDNSGSWGRGGFFTAVENAFPEAKENYELAGLNDDLLLGSTHLVPSNVAALPPTQQTQEFEDEAEDKSKEEEEVPQVYIANAVVQSRTKKTQAISGIRMNDLRDSLNKVAQEAKKLGASVHLPRLGQGTEGFNWYNIEQTIRKTLIRQGIQTYVYRFRRQRSNSRGNTPTKGTPLKRGGSSSVEKQQGGTPKKLKMSGGQKEEKKEEKEEEEEPVPDLFQKNGKKDQIWFFQMDPEELPSTQKQAAAFGASVNQKFDKENTSIIVTSLEETTAVLNALKKKSPELEVVNIQWFKDCLDYRKRLPTASYQL
eukprot:TRINITY_DN1641_c0_g1_i3.p1 TRINITY_DN1641_c0_g1~~TRINITY_DN1641_c0_g1_i3.p1  ORF type:complete len:1025 (-),score=451.02 TRINITY_DN1641_c0_g1_i3:67-3141(-)